MTAASRAGLWRDPNFAWLMGGGVISALGDQFSMIALPWLVLKLTGDPVALGLVVALMGIPRAVLILFGGALVDRYSPKRVLMLTKHVNTVLLAILCVLVYTAQATLPLVIALALGLSLASAFSIPAGTSMLPHAIAPERLQAANGMMMGIRQATMLAGPLLAGLLFALGGDGSAGMADARGLALAFGFDAFSFALSAWTLAQVTPLRVTPAAPQPVLRAIGEGLALVWRDLTLRTCFIYWGLCACIVGGTMQVAMPLLASERLHGASALGLLMGAHGAGALAGMALSSLPGRRRLGNLGMTLLAVDGIIGLLLLPLRQCRRVHLAAAARAAGHAGTHDEHLHVRLHGPGADGGGAGRLARGTCFAGDAVRRRRPVPGRGGAAGLAVHADARARRCSGIAIRAALTRQAGQGANAMPSWMAPMTCAWFSALSLMAARTSAMKAGLSLACSWPTQKS